MPARVRRNGRTPAGAPAVIGCFRLSAALVATVALCPAAAGPGCTEGPPGGGQTPGPGQQRHPRSIRAGR
jgi:hypothetical protein